MVFSPHSSHPPPLSPLCRYSATLATSIGVDAVMGAKNANYSFLSLFKGSFEANAKDSSSLSEVIDVVVDEMPPAWGSTIAKCLRSANAEVRVASTRYCSDPGHPPRVANTLHTEMRHSPPSR